MTPITRAAALARPLANSHATTRSPILALNGIRAVVALNVFFTHWLFDAPRSWPLVAQAAFLPGTSRVSVFFALTGFVVVLRYGDEIRANSFSYGRYLLRRLIRIYPLYFFVLTFLVMALGRPVSVVPTTARGIAANYGMAQALFSDLVLSGIQTGWTLTIDWLFYLVAPILVALFLGARLRWAAALAVALSLAGLGVAWALSALPNADGTGLLGESIGFEMRYTLFAHMPDFLLGMLAAVVLVRRPGPPGPGRGNIWLINGALVFALVAGIANALVGFDADPIVRRVFEATAAIGVSGLFLGLARDKDRQHALSRALASRPAQILGRLSFALYLIQLTEIPQVIYWILLGSIESIPLHALALLGPVLVLAALLHLLVEQPARRFLDQILNRIQKPQRKVETAGLADMATGEAGR